MIQWASKMKFLGIPIKSQKVYYFYIDTVKPEKLKLQVNVFYKRCMSLDKLLQTRTAWYSCYSRLQQHKPVEKFCCVADAECISARTALLRRHVRNKQWN